MAFHPLSWLLRLAVLCHLVLLLTGQQHGVKKCSYTCNGATPKIPLRLLAGYRRREASCGKPEIILTTIKNRTFCADSEEKWVQEAVEYLNRKAEPTPGRRIGSMTAPEGTDRPPASEPTAAEESSSQETRRAPGTSPEPPRSPTTSLAPDGAPSDGPERTKLFNVTAATAAAAATTTTTTTTTTATSWQSPRQPTADLWAEKASETASTQALPTDPPSSQALSTQALPTDPPSSQTPSTQALPTDPPSSQALSTQALPTDPPSTQAPSSQTPSTQALPTDPPSTQAPSTQAPSTQALPTDPPSTQAPSPQAPATSHTAPDPGQDLTPESPLGSSSAHTDADTGPGGPQRRGILTTPVTDPEATRRQAVGLLAFLGLLFCLGVALFTYQRLQGCTHSAVGDMVAGLRYVPRSCGSNSYVLVPV